MARTLLTELKPGVKNFTLEPSGGGCFELQVDGNLVYSKLETGEFPEEAAIVKKVQSIG